MELHARVNRMNFSALSLSCALILFCIPSLAQDMGPADMREDIHEAMPSSSHDAWCQKLHNKCKVVFQGDSMKVDGYKGIRRSQLTTFRINQDGGERYIYVDYIDSRRRARTALFLFANFKAADEFQRAIGRWWAQDPSPYPNYRHPNSQGPQDTHGR